MDFQDQMEIGKANAKRDRDRGGSTIRVFATATARFQHLDGLDELELLVASYRQAIHTDAYEAVNHALFSHEWEDLPF